jgi:putative ABC transport system substrate-binding protein
MDQTGGEDDHSHASGGAARGFAGPIETMIARGASRGLLGTLLVLLAVNLTGTDTALAQRSRPVKIGALTAGWGPSLEVVGLRTGLRELGYREDIDFVIGVRFTQGKAADLPAAARELIRLGVDVLVADGTGDAAKAAQAAAQDRVPIVFIGTADPVARGLVRSLARPGGNITGVASLDGALGPKRLEIFRQIVPRLARVLLPYDAAEPAFDQMLAVYRAAARRLGLILIEKPVRTEDEARVAVAEMRKGLADGIVTPSRLSLNIPGFMLEAAVRHVVPTMFNDVFFVERGGLASYAANHTELGRQAARLVDRIIKGAQPADLPVEQPTKFELVINLKAATALGLAIPPPVLLRADRIIE